MSYHHRLERPDGRPITLSDFEALSSARENLVIKDGAVLCEADGSWFGIHQDGGEWWAERLSDSQILELAKIAQALGAKLIGDEDEVYTVIAGEMMEALPPAPRQSSMRTFLERNVIGLIAFVVFFLLAYFLGREP